MNGETPWRLALPMYNNSPGLAEAARVLLRRVVQGLRAQGWTEPMALAEPGGDPVGFWQSPRMLLSQTCGYPLVTRLADQVEVVARPHYALDGCEDHSYCSFVVVRADAGIDDLAALQGKRLAANSPDSHSGMNALRHLLAPLAAPRLVNGRFFQQVLWSGAHANSLAMVQARLADCAAIDCVTFANLSQQRPEAVEDLRVLARTAQAPSLPWICNQRLSDEQRAQLRELVLHLPGCEPAACATLHLRRFKPATRADYRPIQEMEDSAIRRGYAVLG